MGDVAQEYSTSSDHSSSSMSSTKVVQANHPQAFTQNQYKTHSVTSNYTPQNERVKVGRPQQPHRPSTLQSTTPRQIQNDSNLSLPIGALPQIKLQDAKVQKRGYLEKKGHYIPNWRKRYFVLYSNGQLLGWKDDPRPKHEPDRDEYYEGPDDNRETPLNNFHIRYAQIFSNTRDNKGAGNTYHNSEIPYVSPHNYQFSSTTRDDISRATVTRDDMSRRRFSVKLCQNEDFRLDQAAVRNFNAASRVIRESWIKAITMVRNNCLNVQHQQIHSAASGDSSQNMVGTSASSSPSISIPGLLHPPRSDTQANFLPDPEDIVGFDSFEFLKVLGRGNFGKVLLVRQKKNQKTWAMKVIRKDIMFERLHARQVQDEALIVRKLRHPFLIRCMYSFEDDYRVCHVLQYANGGELFEHLRQVGTFTEERSRFYAAEITSAFHYLHGKNIVYRDLKLENILLDADGHILLTDFGLCKQQASAYSLMTTLCGTPEYIAPEVIDDDQYCRSVDWWALGVVLYEMLIGRLPFYSTDQTRLFQQILELEPTIPNNISNECRNLILNLLMKDPEVRIGCNKQRGGSKEVMEHPFFRSIDFELLYHRRISPPWTPDLSSVYDVKYFCTNFTSMPAVLTPPDEMNRDALIRINNDSPRLQWSAGENYDHISHVFE